MPKQARLRERRSGWAAAIDVKLTPRDIGILVALGTCGVLRTRDLQRLFFNSRTTCCDRLRKLLCGGYIEIVETASGRRFNFALEVDLGTESAANQIVRKKLAAYARYAATSTPLYGSIDPLVIVAAKNLRRVRTIAQEMEAQAVRARVVFTLASLLTESNVLGAAYALPQDILASRKGIDERLAFKRALLP